MKCLFLVLFLASSASASDLVSLARVDREQFPEGEWPYLFYLSTAHLEGEEKQDLVTAIKFMVCSSSLQPVIEHSIPIAIDENSSLLRIDLRGLQWKHSVWKSVIESNPYGPPYSIIIRADWLLLELADSHKSPAYNKLLYGGVKTRDELLSKLSVGSDPKFRFGIIEGNSGVSKSKARWIENRPVPRGYAWGTKDVLELTFDKDPLEHPLGDFKHDGEEWIIGVPKLSSTTGQRGTLQVYALANSAGKIVGRAPVDLVEDSTAFRGFREIRYPGSCVQCHASGLNDFTKNALKDLLESGVELYAEYEKQQRIDAFHLSDLTKEVERNKEDFAAIVSLVTGLTPIESAACFRRAVNQYVAPVDLETAAFELGANPEELKKALALASSREQITGRIASLAHGQSISRDSWAEKYLVVQQYWGEWKNAN